MHVCMYEFVCFVHIYALNDFCFQCVCIRVNQEFKKNKRTLHLYSGIPNGRPPN